jgi:hypothetical protein
MKKLFCLFAILSLLSCDREEKPVPSGPNPDLISQQQAPFGSMGVDIKLQKVLYNGRLASEYIYEGDYLSQGKKYAFIKPVLWAVRSYYREAGLVKSSSLIAADISPEAGTVSKDFNPRHNVTFITPWNDSTRTLSMENLPVSQTYSNVYTFDKDGFVVKETTILLGRNEAEYTYSYTRNAKHNITESRQISYQNTDKPYVVRYGYDDHPNPFFNLGVDWQDQLSINSYSPNNIIRETHIDTNGEEYHIDYTYEYYGNGYPKKVTIAKDIPLSTPYILEFLY